MPTMAFRDRDGREHQITGPELIDKENEDTKAELKKLRAALVSSDPMLAPAAEKAAETLFTRREQLKRYAEEWNRLVDQARRERRVEFVKAIDALDAGEQA